MDGLLGALRGQHGGLLLALGRLDRRLPQALGVQDHRALVPVGAHLLLHRLLDGRRRIDRLELDPGDPDAPLAGGLVQHPAQLPVDRVAAGQRLFQVHPADHVAQRGGGQLLDGDDVVGDLVDGGPRVGDLEVHDGVDGDGQVVLGDHRLRREGDHLLAQVDAGPDPVQERHQPDQPGAAGLVEPAEPFDHGGLGLRDHLDRADEHDDHQDDDDDGDDQYWIHDCLWPPNHDRGGSADLDDCDGRAGRQRRDGPPG